MLWRSLDAGKEKLRKIRCISEVIPSDYQFTENILKNLGTESTDKNLCFTFSCMIPFEREVSLNETEEYVEGLLQGRWDNVVRSTPGIKEDLQGRFPELSETVSRKIREDTDTEFSSVFRPGVPDFLVFDDTGEYLFVEVNRVKTA